MKNLPRLMLLATMLAGSSSVLAQGEGSAVPADPAAAPPPLPVVAPSPVAEVPPQPQPPLPPQPQSATEEPDVSGFAFELRLDNAQILDSSNQILPVFSPGLFLGFYSRAVTFGIGFELLRISREQTAAGTTEDASSTSLIVIPGVRFALARSADKKNELLGVADAGYGISTSSRSTSTTDAPTVSRIRAQAGLGMRHWITPSFAVGGTAGLRFDRQSVSDDTSDESFTIMALFTSLQMTGVF